MMASLESSAALVFTHVFTSGQENEFKCYCFELAGFLVENAADNVADKVALCARERKVMEHLLEVLFFLFFEKTTTKKLFGGKTKKERVKKHCEVLQREKGTRSLW